MNLFLENEGFDHDCLFRGGESRRRILLLDPRNAVFCDSVEQPAIRAKLLVGFGLIAAGLRLFITPPGGDVPA